MDFYSSSWTHSVEPVPGVSGLSIALFLTCQEPLCPYFKYSDGFFPLCEIFPTEL